MKFAKILGVATAAVLGLAMMAPVSQAGVANQLTKVTFSQPVEIPGNKVLSAGTYWFKLEDHTDLPNVVLIFNAKQTQLDAMLLTRTTFRNVAADETTFTVAKPSPGRPMVALMKWYYPGKNYGEGFIYSPATLQQFAQAGTERLVGSEVRAEVAGTQSGN